MENQESIEFWLRAAAKDLVDAKKAFSSKTYDYTLSLCGQAFEKATKGYTNFLSKKEGPAGNTPGSPELSKEFGPEIFDLEDYNSALSYTGGSFEITQSLFNKKEAKRGIEMAERVLTKMFTKMGRELEDYGKLK
ncbi:MAG: HEPN domain-containing protein [Candidatus Zixiibacteriota bacterium]|nr:MAG: HEPN domain-containing protein [candidate division Zixibacteria bacterium]